MQMKKMRIVTLLLILPLVAFAQKKWTLKECIAYAKENNLSIRQFTYQKINQELAIKSNRNEALPSVNGNFGFGYNFGFIQNIFGVNETAESISANLGISSQVLLYNNGTIKLNLERSKLQLESIEWASERAFNDLSLQIATAYLNILLNEELKKVAEKTLNISQQNLERNEKLFKSGALAQAAYLEVKAAYANDLQAYENAKINIERAKFDLAMLLQITDYKNFDVEIVSVSDAFADQLIEIESIIEYAIEHQPQVKDAKVRLQIAEKDLQLARNQMFPTVAAQYQFGTNYIDFFLRRDPGLTEQWWDNQNHSIGIGVTIPIFNKNQNRFRVEQARVSIESAKLTVEQEAMNLRQTIQTAYFDLNATYRNYLAQKDVLEARKKAFELAEKSYQAGFTNIYDYTISRNNLFIAESNFLQAKFNLLFRMKVLDFYAGKPLDM